MSDSERTFLDVAIMEVLPELPAVHKNILEEHLQSIGVETYDDLRFVTEADLMTALRPVQARKLLSVWKQKYQTPENSSLSSVETSATQSLSSLSVSPRSSSSTSSSSPGLDTQWDDNFEIPWSKFPEEVMHSLERGKRPGPKLRREMVRIVVTEMMEKCPHVETQESQQQKMGKLKVMFQHSDANPEEVKCLMKSTFYTQRQHVNQGKSIKCLREEWPFWFHDLGMSVHFKELTGIDLKETFTRNLDLKGKRLLDYMTTVCVNKSKKFLQNYARLQRMRGPQSGCSDDVIEMLLLLLSYFDEKEESMFFHVEDTCLAEEVQLEQVPLTPTVIVCGQSCYSSTRYMLSLDRNLTNTNISSFISALCLMFGSYYCFNIHYPSELASTSSKVSKLKI
ncbi:hypothetical protein EPR50_G00125360 [Perca flavescens]|uniref:Uncharacterized protein n=1 Tax=Perca flavescens TaxID=8167 RepID=A0A484CQ55_PERFV|nr:hypothetical protein EPR50_G00125360 [Perca flavescens]